ncbi:MAG: D-alanyl-D-alanine carboxypeptidase [Spirochaetaceae bacterium]|nr:D-alanyl-D-alanine carboxypeptidase [Spirochaetaceae bacterium]
MLLLISAAGFALEPIPGPENLSAPVYVVADAETGVVILEQSAETLLSPASLAKLMTLHLSLSDVAIGHLSNEKLYPIPPGGEALAMRPGSSVLGLTAGDEAALITLQRAAALVSANDAAWTLALLSCTNGADFILRMNQEADVLGMRDTVYYDPDGWSSRSLTTGADQMRLALNYLEKYPGILEQVHVHSNMIYLDTDKIAHHPASKNTNLLIGRVEGVDGLKTGTIPSAGFHFIATAEREKTRFIAIVMGIKTESYVEGLNKRSDDAAILLEWAFRNYFTWKPCKPDLIRIPVRHGETDSVSLEITDSIESLTLQRSDEQSIVMMVDAPEYLTAPLDAGGIAGMVRWYRYGELLLERPLRITAGVGRRWRIRDIF